MNKYVLSLLVILFLNISNVAFADTSTQQLSWTVKISGQEKYITENLERKSVLPGDSGDEQPIIGSPFSVSPQDEIDLIEWSIYLQGQYGANCTLTLEKLDLATQEYEYYDSFSIDYPTTTLNPPTNPDEKIIPSIDVEETPGYPASYRLSLN